MVRRHYFIIEAHYEEKRHLDVWDSVYRWPVDALDELLEVGEEGEYVIDHFAY
jgi:hypothetical protein